MHSSEVYTSNTYGVSVPNRFLKVAGNAQDPGDMTRPERWNGSCAASPAASVDRLRRSRCELLTHSIDAQSAAVETIARSTWFEGTNAKSGFLINQ